MDQPRGNWSAAGVISRGDGGPGVVSSPVVLESQRGGHSLPNCPEMNQKSRIQEAGLRACGCPHPTSKPALWRGAGVWKTGGKESVIPEAVPAPPGHVSGQPHPRPAVLPSPRSPPPELLAVTLRKDQDFGGLPMKTNPGGSSATPASVGLPQGPRAAAPAGTRQESPGSGAWLSWRAGRRPGC